MPNIPDSVDALLNGDKARDILAHVANVNVDCLLVIWTEVEDDILHFEANNLLASQCSFLLDKCKLQILDGDFISEDDSKDSKGLEQ